MKWLSVMTGSTLPARTTTSPTAAVGRISTTWRTRPRPVLLKSFLSGPRSHTATPTADGKTLIVAEERPNGNVHLYDISMINQPNDPDTPALLKTLNRTSVGIDAHSPHHPHLHGNLLFLGWYEAGLQVFNIADPANPVHVGAFDTYPGTSTLYYGNWGSFMGLGLSTVLLSDRQRGLMIVDASELLTPGDFNQDGFVNAADYSAWRSEFNQDVFHHGTLIADANNDGFVNAADYVVWRANAMAGGAAASAATVPEPASMWWLLVFVGNLAWLRFRRGATAGRRSAVADLSSSGYCRWLMP